MRERRLVVGVLAMALSLAIATGYIGWVRGGTVMENHRGTVSILAGDHFHFTFALIGDGLNEFAFEFIVLSGPNVDVYLLTESDYRLYLAGSSPVSMASSYIMEDIRIASDSPYFPEGLYHVIIDNSDFGIAQPLSDPSTVQYLLTAGGSPGRLWVHSVVLILCLIGALGGTALILAARGVPR